MIFDWPANLEPEDLMIVPPHKTAGFSTGLTAFSQRIPAIRPPFSMRLEFGNIFGDEVLAWRAVEGLFEGRTNIVRIPLFDLWFRAKDADIGAGTVTFSDGTAFSDGALWATNDLSGVEVTAEQGARHITVDFGSYGHVLQAGLYFGIGEHPYLATGVWWDGNVAKIRSTPTLRRDCEGERLKLRPTMLAGLKEDDGIGLMLRRARYGAPALDLVERFDEPLS